MKVQSVQESLNVRDLTLESLTREVNNHQDYITMDLYEILLQRIILLTDEYLQLKERVKELENEAKIRNSTTPRIIKMRIEKAK